MECRKRRWVRHTKSAALLFTGGVMAAAMLAGIVPGSASAAAAGGVPRTGASSNGFVSFSAFTAQLQESSYASFAELDPSMAQGPTEFVQSRGYLIHLYAGVDVQSSFFTGGAYFDCVTVASQPSVTQPGITQIAQPPPGSSEVAGTPWTTSGVDQSGAAITCPLGTVPVRRTTLQQIVSYPDLEKFLQAKSGIGSAEEDVPGYRHAYGYQVVNNDGASSVLSVWNPAVSDTGEDHSLSQQWVLGGSGAQTQTAEAGWTKDPNFSDSLPVYFVYFTANDYASTGCYNLECAGFVQTNASVGLGAPVTPCCSTVGHVNDSFTQTWVLFKKDWWLEINGVDIGYYPVSVYNGGQMSKHSTIVEFGGEVYGGETTVNWPPMGSGRFASAGPKKAAYQSSIEYVGLNSQASWANLTTVDTGGGASPSPCYSISYSPASGQTGPLFYYGGPGGKQGRC